jgi:hypothetical protein
MGNQRCNKQSKALAGAKDSQVEISFAPAGAFNFQILLVPKAQRRGLQSARPIQGLGRRIYYRAAAVESALTVI